MKKIYTLIFSIFLLTGITHAQLPELVDQKIANLTQLEKNIQSMHNIDLKVKKRLLFTIQKSKKALLSNQKRDIETLQGIEKKINTNNKKIIKTVLESKKEKLIKKYKRVGVLILKFKSEGKSVKKLEALQERMKIALDTL